MQQVTGSILAVKQETHDVKTFVIELEEPIDYTPGQYCLVAISDVKTEGLTTTKRPFTFATPPSGNKIELTVKRVGEFTTALHSLQERDELTIHGPRGSALNFDANINKDVVFLAGGSGITPFMASLRFAVREHLENNFTLLFSNRAESDIIYQQELANMNERNGINVIFTLDGEVPDDWQGETGHIDRKMIEKHVNSPQDRLWYICGPPLMVDAMRDIMGQMAIPETEVRTEDWELPGKHD